MILWVGGIVIQSEAKDLECIHVGGIVIRTNLFFVIQRSPFSCHSDDRREEESDCR